MATPFATASDLAVRLKRPMWDELAELDQVEQFLSDASDLLRAELGWQVYPPATVTVTAEPDAYGHIQLPGSPVGAVTSVTVGGQPVTHDVHNGTVHVYSYGLVTVTYTVGYAAPPPDLTAWTCVLAAQMLSRAALGDGGLGGTPASLAIEDVRANFSAQQQSGELGIPERSLHRLRSTYGRTTYVT